MKIDDKDIEKMLEDFSGEEIEIPSELEEGLNNKLITLKPKKRKKTLVAAVASILLISLSYSTIPSFKSFADGVIKYVFGDAGIDNAVNHGYNFIPTQNINIKGYEIEISNIYMDKLRLGFDVNLKRKNNIPMKKYDEELELFISEKSLDYSYSTDYAILRKDDEYKAKIETLGDAITNLYNKKQDRIELELVLRKNISYSSDENNEIQVGEEPPEIKTEIIGNYNLVLEMPKEIYNNKEIVINEKIKDEKLNLEIQRLELSPTMMYLYSKGNVDNYPIRGLYNLRIVSENNKTFKENLNLIGRGSGEQWQQTIVPSIYYEKGNKAKLKADGVHFDYIKDIEINIHDTYPKKIEYFNDTITINKVEIIEKEISIEIIGNKNIAHLVSNTSLDGIETNGTSVMNDEKSKFDKYTYYFTVEEKEKYNFKLELVVKYPMPMEIDLKVD